MIGIRGHFLAGFGLAVMALAVALPMPASATPRSAIDVIEVLGAGNPDHVALRDGTFSGEIAIGAAVATATPGATPDPKLAARNELQKLKLGDELAVAVQKALVAKGLKSYVAGELSHPWPTSSLQLTIDDTRYERRGEGKIGPNLVIRFRLYDATSRDKLLGNTYIYDLYAKTIGWSVVRPPEEFGLDNPEDLQARPDVVLSAMRKGIDLIAAQIATDIMADVEE
jgi:hypothetical protein